MSKFERKYVINTCDMYLQNEILHILQQIRKIIKPKSTKETLIQGVQNLFIFNKSSLPIFLMA